MNDAGGDGTLVFSPVGYDGDDVIQMGDIPFPVSLVGYEDVFVDLDAKLGRELEEGNEMRGNLGGRSYGDGVVRAGIHLDRVERLLLYCSEGSYEACSSLLPIRLSLIRQSILCTVRLRTSFGHSGGTGE